jgi:6-phosphogluconate dehydrogenase (decarboxylating)
VTNQDGGAVLDISRNQITTLNSTGGFVWERLQQGRAVEEIIHDLAAESGTDPTTVERGVRRFLDQLRSEHLLTD